MYRNKQSGITVIGFVIILILVVFAGFIGMKLFPIYQEYFSVVQAMKGVASQPGIASRSPAEIKEALDKRFFVSYVTNVKRQDVKVLRKGGVQLNVKYNVQTHLIGNLDVIAKFDHTVDLSGR